MPAPPNGPEDKLAVELVAALRKKPLPHEEWKKKIDSLPPGPKGKSPGRNGTSVNWWWTAVGVGAIEGHPEAQRTVSEYLSIDNDLDMSECYASLGMYFAYNLIGRTVARDAFRFGQRRNEALAKKLDAELIQLHASLLLLSTTPDTLRENMVLMAGPRGGSAKAGDGKYHRGIFEYLVLRSAGWTDERIQSQVPGGKQMVKQISGDDPIRALTHLKTLVGLVLTSLQADADPAWRAFQAGGYPSLVRLVTKGTRAPFRWIRTSGGLLAVMERNCNPFKGPKVVALWERGKDPIGFPFGAKKTGFVTSEGRIDEEHWWVTAKAEGCGSFSHSIPGGSRIFDLRLSISGVQNLLAGDVPPEDEEEIPPPPPPDPGEESPDDHEPDDRKWYEKLWDWLRGRD